MGGATLVGLGLAGYVAYKLISAATSDAAQGAYSAANKAVTDAINSGEAAVSSAVNTGTAQAVTGTGMAFNDVLKNAPIIGPLMPSIDQLQGGFSTLFNSLFGNPLKSAGLVPSTGLGGMPIHRATLRRHRIRYA